MDFREIVDDDPVVVDPSWDVGKVYFSEFQGDKKENNKADDMIFATSWTQEGGTTAASPAVPVLVVPISSNHDDALDPLGWPRQPTGFSNPLGESDDDALLPVSRSDDDDQELLQSYHPDSSYTGSGGFLTNVLCEGVSNILSNVCGKVGTQMDKNVTMMPLAKEERIQMYVTKVADDESIESSVEDNREEEEWDENINQVEYSAQDEKDEEEIQDVFALLKEKETVLEAKVSDKHATFDVAAQAAEKQHKKDGTIKTVPVKPLPVTSKKEARRGPIPLLKPPMEEKLSKYVEHKMRQSKHLEATKKKKKEKT